MVSSGIETFIQDSSYHSLFFGKRTALLTNYTACTRSFKTTVDVLQEKTTLVKLFTPEHGLYGAMQAGEPVVSHTDAMTGLSVISMYSDSKEIPHAELRDIDVLACDIQDVGLRFYTYIYTMAYGIKAAAKWGIPFVIFDRPNPFGGDFIHGNQIDKSCTSFVGKYGLPQRYGMTIGELARYISVYEKIKTPIYIIPLTGWTRTMTFDDTGLPWILPSPNLPTLDSLFAYYGTCLVEGTNLSEGRGTTKPMECIGAPWIQNEKKLAQKLSDYMHEKGIVGLQFRPHKFIPTFSKYAHELCNGFQLYSDPALKKRAPILEATVLLLNLIKQEYPSDFLFCTLPNDNTSFFIDRLSGSSSFRKKNATLYLQEIQNGSKFFFEILHHMTWHDGSPLLLYEGDIGYE